MGHGHLVKVRPGDDRQLISNNLFDHILKVSDQYIKILS